MLSTDSSIELAAATPRNILALSTVDDPAAEKPGDKMSPATPPSADVRPTFFDRSALD